ncbi:LysR family transcriptional regulator [Kitasatospora sp. NBC_01250]|uniref:LysR family transcriptional regulator n=1 Tax=Kitasatospora sp. NBC_01250 TaxID=2903571 RepID=UPI002E3748CE|nr:LysR family transcriptional regulator [Kitasatospora sp. NBC_01250]
MDLRQMRYFTVLAEELNFTRAARRLHIAQPALSQQVKALERRLGARLIERGSTGCTLTAVGEVVAQEARGVLARATAAEERIAAAVAGRHGRLNLAYTRSARGGPADALVSAFRERHPEVELRLQTGWTAHNVTLLLAGQLDAAFVRPPLDAPELTCLPLGEEELLLAVPADHPLAATRSRISRRRIATEPVILWPRENGPGMHDLIIRQLWPDHGPRIVREEPDDEQLLLAVAAGHGVAPIPEGRAHALRVPGIRLRRLTAPTPTVGLGLAYDPRVDARALQFLLSLARDR